MALFQYSAYTAAGRIETGEVEARSGDEALGLLAARGLTPFKTAQVLSTRGQRGSLLAAQSGLRPSDIAHMTRELATLLEAEIPLDEALRLLKGQNTNARSARLADQLLAQVVAGASLSTALAQQDERTLTFVASLVRAGEARGTLGATLAEIARLLEARAEARARVRSALVYPLFLAAIALGTLGIVLIVLFPALLQLFEDSRVEPPLALALTRDIARFLAEHWLLAIAAALALGTFAALSLRRLVVRGQLERWLQRLPLLGELRSKLAVAVLTRTLGILIRNGVPVVEALTITTSVVPSRALAKALNTATEALKQGRRFSHALAAGGLLPPTVARLVTIGEETSRLDTMLLHLADMYDRDAARLMERAVTLLSPVITVVIGLMIGGIVLSVMQAILSVNTLAIR